MTSASNQAACRSLATLGWPDPPEALATFRSHLLDHGVEPLQTVHELMASSRLLCLGEMHDFAGRFMAADMVLAAARAGARWLFIEVYTTEQPRLDRFSAGASHEELPDSAGGGRAQPMRFQQPYVEMLYAARHAGMHIVAIDVEGADFDQRNRAMAETIVQHLGAESARREKGVAVVGQLHLIPRALFGSSLSMAALLRPSLGGEVVTVGRAVPNVQPEFSVWADVAGVSAPVLLRSAASPFAELASTYCDETLVGADFDLLFFYPAAAVLA